MSVIQNAINDSCLVTTFTSSGTWNVNPRTKAISVWGWDGGSGGGSGRRGLTGASSGGAGGAGGYFIEPILPKFLFGSSSYSVTIGDFGAGGVAQGTNNTDGNHGSEGGTTSVGNLYTASVMGTTYGLGGTATGVAGSFGKKYTTTNILSVVNLSSFLSGIGSLVDGGPATSNVSFGFCGGPGGGGAGADSVTARRGGDGNPLLAGDSLTVLVAVSAGGIETGTIDGAAGTAGSITAGLSGRFQPGTGGGGGGGQKSGGAAGNGGNGGFPGAGGGGGGGSLNGTASGKGGDGAKGALLIIEYF